MADEEFEPPSRLNSSYSQAAIDEQFQEMRENSDSKFESILAKIENSYKTIKCVTATAFLKIC